MSLPKVIEILSGQNRTLGGHLLRALLWALTPIYWLGWRLKMATAGKSSKPDVPVLSVGNLTTGGTGKTPMVLWLAKHLLTQGHNPVILSRGYGKPKANQRSDGNDEYLELKWHLPETPHLQHPDRVAIAFEAVQNQGASCLILDDGFQHQRLGRDLNLLLIDATCPFGYGHLLPRGLLREPLSQIRRADLICLTRCEQVDSEKLTEIESTLRRIAPECTCIRASSEPSKFLGTNGQWPISKFKGESVFAFAGIGNPENFQRGLERAGVNVAGTKWFADHHAYSQKDLQDILESFQSNRATTLVCTMKDFVKIRELDSVPSNLFALVIELKIPDARFLEERIEEIFSAETGRET